MLLFGGCTIRDCHTLWGTKCLSFQENNGKGVEQRPCVGPHWGRTKKGGRMAQVSGPRLQVGGLRMPRVRLRLLGIPKELLWGLIGNSIEDLHFSHKFTLTF